MVRKGTGVHCSRIMRTILQNVSGQGHECVDLLDFGYVQFEGQLGTSCGMLQMTTGQLCCWLQTDMFPLYRVQIAVI